MPESSYRAFCKVMESTHHVVEALRIPGGLKKALCCSLKGAMELVDNIYAWVVPPKRQREIKEGYRLAVGCHQGKMPDHTEISSKIKKGFEQSQKLKD